MTTQADDPSSPLGSSKARREKQEVRKLKAEVAAMRAEQMRRENNSTATVLDTDDDDMDGGGGGGGGGGASSWAATKAKAEAAALSAKLLRANALTKQLAAEKGEVEEKLSETEGKLRSAVRASQRSSPSSSHKVF